jgi:pimeloyl-ACP methyl ester carboxylesterase
MNIVRARISARLLRAAFVLVIASNGVASSAPPAPSRPVGRITWYPYVLRISDGSALQAELGRLVVPENRARAGSKSIELAFVRIKSTAAVPGPPIILVAGGPGTSGIDMPRGNWFTSLATLRQAGDVIALDQRGIGLSRPTLECAETFDIPLNVVRTRETYLQEFRQKSRACRVYWESQGVDLGAYHTESSADDIDDLRAALGAEKMTLVGGSYGSHLILSTIRRHGAHVARALITGTEGPDHTAKLPSNGAKQLAKVAKAVAADAEMGTLVPDLQGLVRTVLDTIEKQPVTVNVVDGKTNRPVTMMLSRFDLQLVTAQGLGSSAFIRQLPAAYYEMAHGNFTWLAQEVLKKRGQPLGSAMGWEMDCASGISDARLAQIRRETPESPFGDVLDFPVPDVCDAWVANDRGPAFRAPITSTVPVLFFSGTLDGRTPPTNADEVKAGFVNGVHIVVENATHSGKEMVFTLPGTKETALTFLKGGTVASTTAALPAWQFAKPEKH